MLPTTSPTSGTNVGSVSVSGGSVPTSASSTFNSAAEFYWAAFSSSDSDTTPAVSCSPSLHDALPISKVTIATSLVSNPITVGGSTTDSATLTSAFKAGGTVD